MSRLVSRPQASGRLVVLDFGLATQWHLRRIRQTTARARGDSLGDRTHEQPGVGGGAAAGAGAVSGAEGEEDGTWKHRDLNMRKDSLYDEGIDEVRPLSGGTGSVRYMAPEVALYRPVVAPAQNARDVFWSFWSLVWSERPIPVGCWSIGWSVGCWLAGRLVDL